MKFILIIFLNITIVGLFLFSKILPYKDRLNIKYKGILVLLNNMFTPVLNFLKMFIKPIQIGQGLSVDLTHIILLIFLLILLNTL